MKQVLLASLLAITVVFAIHGQSLAKPNTPPIVDVFVANDENNPVPVVLNNPVPVVLSAPVQSDTGVINGDTAAIVYTVPAGFRLNIQFVSISGTADDAAEGSEDIIRISVETILDGGDPIRHQIGYVLRNTRFKTGGGFNFSSLVQLYADPGTEVEMRVTNQFGIAVIAWGGTISGRLEPLN